MVVITASGWSTTGIVNIRLQSLRQFPSPPTLILTSTTVWTPTLSACSPTPPLTAPTSSRESSLRLRASSALDLTATASMQTSPVVQVGETHLWSWPGYVLESDWGLRYWEDYSGLMSMKNHWDPENMFNHCHSVGSTDNTCCPDYQVPGHTWQ